MGLLWCRIFDRRRHLHQGQSIDFPKSVNKLFCGWDLGQPVGGFPEKLQKNYFERTTNLILLVRQSFSP